jgi:PAS domain S-box-containing protein
MGEQWILAAGLVYAVVMTIALVRLGRGEGGPHWAAAWICLWGAGGVVLAGETWSGAIPLGAMLGTATATLFVTGTLRFVGRPVPNALWVAAACVALLRAALAPWLGEAGTDAVGSLLIFAASLTSSALLLGQRRGDGSRRYRLLAAAFPAAAVGSTVYVASVFVGAEAWVGIFVWLMAAILLSGIQVLSMVQRIAERSEGQRAVLSSLIESVPVGLALFDSRGQLRAANPAFQKLVGPADDDAPIVRESDALGALADQVEAADADALQGAGNGGGEPGRELHFKSGLRVGLTVHVVTGAAGGLVGHLWLLRDVTEERRLQESLERARRLETLGGFAGGVAHDFNNQLTSVLGNATLARESLEPAHPAQEILADLASSAEHCARLTRDVLDFARRGPARPERIDLATLLPAVLARHARARAHLELAPGVPAILVDPTQVERVVANLADNARYAAGEHGRVEVRVRPDERPGRVAIEVADDGPGIEEPVRARIFDPFFTTKPVGEGSGLGLAIVYGIVSGQGGEVRVEGGPGEGTRMVTTWPVAPDAD